MQRANATFPRIPWLIFAVAIVQAFGLGAGTQSLAAETIFKAAEQGDLAEVQRHLAAGAALDGRDAESDATPLLWAAGFGHLEVVKFLVANGADVNQRVQKGFTALIGAVDGGHL